MILDRFQGAKLMEDDEDQNEELTADLIRNGERPGEENKGKHF